MYTRMGNS